MIENDEYLLTGSASSLIFNTRIQTSQMLNLWQKLIYSFVTPDALSIYLKLQLYSNMHIWGKIRGISFNDCIS